MYSPPNSLKVPKKINFEMNQIYRNIGHPKKINCSDVPYILPENKLYAKTNIHIYPCQDTSVCLVGYLFLARETSSSEMLVGWSPDYLPESKQNFEFEKYCAENAFTVALSSLACIHCHDQQRAFGNERGLIFIGVDGVNYPQLFFPTGSHLFQFLLCLETALSPGSQLEPPLITQKDKLVPNDNSEETELALKHDVRSAHMKDVVFCIRNTGVKENCKMRFFPDQVQPECTIQTIKEKVATQRSLKSKSFMPMSSQLSKLGHSVDLSFFYNSLNQKTRNSNLKAVIHSSDPGTKIERKGISSPTKIISPCCNSLSESILQLACLSMRIQLMSRVFNGWRAYCQHAQSVRKHLAKLIKMDSTLSADTCDSKYNNGVTRSVWKSLRAARNMDALNELYKFAYCGGVESEIRVDVWPYLLGFFDWFENKNEFEDSNLNFQMNYEKILSEWTAVEAIVRERDKEAYRSARQTQVSESGSLALSHNSANLCNDVFLDDEVDCLSSLVNFDSLSRTRAISGSQTKKMRCSKESGFVSSASPPPSSKNGDFYSTDKLVSDATSLLTMDELTVKNNLIDEPRNIARQISEVSSITSEGGGGMYAQEVIDAFATNLHRIERDVQRCDRNNPFFTQSNLEKLQNVLCTSAWKHLDHGYVQGMCDLAAPLLVVLKNEALTYGCFERMMKRLISNFSISSEMDKKLDNVGRLLQIIDNDFFDFLMSMGEYAHFYFCYRWFLLDFKREFKYEDVFSIWETIWAACHVTTEHFDLFLSLALIEVYKDVIIGCCSDFTDIIKFFNETAEKHNPQDVLNVAREILKSMHEICNHVKWEI